MIGWPSSKQAKAIASKEYRNNTQYIENGGKATRVTGDLILFIYWLGHQPSAISHLNAINQPSIFNLQEASNQTIKSNFELVEYNSTV